MAIHMAKTIKEERLRWVLPIAGKELKLVDAARACPYGKRSLERWLAKNFLTSHFKTQQVLVLFWLTLYANARKRLRALCVPLPFRQEYESGIKHLSKN